MRHGLVCVGCVVVCMGVYICFPSILPLAPIPPSFLFLWSLYQLCGFHNECSDFLSYFNSFMYLVEQILCEFKYTKYFAPYHYKQH